MRPSFVRRWRGWSRRRRVITVLALAFVLLIPLPLGVLAVSLRLQYTGEPAAEARTRGQDAIWLGHAWVDGRKSAADVTALAQQLSGTGIRDLYVHAGPLEHDGSIRVALTGHTKWWSKEYFGQVARRVDQIAVMSYDTAMPLESLYGGFVAAQTKSALEITPPEVDLLMGLPAYYENDPSHWGSAETVAAAVRGARLGLGDSDRQNFGLALYIDFTATPEHWTAYRDGWCLTD